MGNSITRLTSIFRVAAGALGTTVDISLSSREGLQPAMVVALNETNSSPQRPAQGGSILKSKSLFIVPARRLNAPKGSSSSRDSKGSNVEFPYPEPVEEAVRRKHSWKNKPIVKEIGKTQAQRLDSRRWSISRQRTSTWEKQFQRREAIQKVDTYTKRNTARKPLKASPKPRASDEECQQQTPPRERTEMTPSRKRQRLDWDDVREPSETPEPVDRIQEKRAKVSVEMTAAGSVCPPPEFSLLETPPSSLRVIPMMRTFPSVPMPILKRLKHLVRLARRRRRFLNSLEVEWPDLMQIDPLLPTGTDIPMSVEGDRIGIASSPPGGSMDFETVFHGGNHFDLEMLDASDEDFQSETELPMTNKALYGSSHTDHISATGNSFSDIQMLSDPLIMPMAVSLMSTLHSMDDKASPVRSKGNSEAEDGSDTELDSEDQYDSDEESGHEDEDESLEDESLEDESLEDESLEGESLECESSGGEGESSGDEEIEGDIGEESGSEPDETTDDEDDASSEGNTRGPPRTPTETEKMMNLLYGAADDVPDEEELRRLEADAAADAEDENQAYLLRQYEQLCKETLGCESHYE